MERKTEKLPLFLFVVSACLISLYGSPSNYSRDLDSAIAAYDNGDFVTAFQKFSRLAKRGNAEAQFYLADMLFGGDGAPQNYAEAIKWYIKAANQGHVNAQYNLGVLYATGQGVPKNHVEAARWFRMAADQGDGEAQHNLGLMYFKGEGVQQDKIQSYMWFILADKNGSPRAEKVRELVAAKMTPEQRAESQKLSTAWKPKSR